MGATSPHNFEAGGAAPPPLNYVCTVDVVLFLYVNWVYPKQIAGQIRGVLVWVGVTLNPGRRLPPPHFKVVPAPLRGPSKVA